MLHNEYEAVFRLSDGKLYKDGNKKWSTSMISEIEEWYKDNRDDEIVDEDESTEDDLWSDEDKKEKERKKSEKGTAQVEQKVNAVAEEKVKQYMDAAVWFKDISERGEMTEKEQRYVELMIIELSKFYFSNLDTLHPSSKCRESICKIFEDIRRAGMC